MPRAKAIQQSFFPYNISGRCINKEWFSLPMDQVWEIFEKELKKTRDKLHLEIHSFVLMSNHFHMLASTPKANISDCMHRFMGNSSLKLSAAGNRINETFAGRHFKTILQHNNHYRNVYKYNYRNPVTAGICEFVEDYAYSTLQTRLGVRHLNFPLADDLAIDGSLKSIVEWLNQQPEPKKIEAIRYGLKRQLFRSKKHRSSGKLIIPDDEII